MIFRITREKRRVQRALAESQLFGSLILTATARARGFDVAEIQKGTRGTTRTQPFTTWAQGAALLSSNVQQVPARVCAVTVVAIRRLRQDSILDVTVRDEASGALVKFTMRKNGMLFAAGGAADLPHTPRLWLGDWPDPSELFADDAAEAAGGQ